MPAYLGDKVTGSTFYGKFTTRGPSGLPTTLAGSPSLRVYRDASTTEITTGVTLVVDFDSMTGLNHYAVDTSTDASAYTAADYTIVIAAGTVTSVTVTGEVVAHFSIQNRSALRPTTAGRTLDVSAGGEAGVDWANIGSPTTAVNLSGTNIDTDQVVASVTGAVGSVTGSVGSVTGITGADVGAIKLKTDQLNFGVTGKVDANITHINEVEIVGDGDGTPFDVA